jgi:hypothetical protein
LDSLEVVRGFARDILENSRLYFEYDPGDSTKQIPGGRYTSLHGSDGHYGLISSSNITAKGTTKAEKPQRKEEKTHYHRADIDKMRQDQNVFKNNVDVFSNHHLYPGMQPHELEGDHETVLHNVKKNGK